MKKKIKLLISIAISAFFLYYAFRDVQFSKISEILKQVNYYYVLLASISTFLGHWIRSIRWKFLIRPLKETKVWELFKITIIAFLSGNILPFRMAEFVRAYLLGEKEKISKTSAFGTIVTERFFDLLGILIISGVFFAFAPVPIYLQRAGILLMFTGIGFTIFIIFIKYKSELIHKIINKILSKFTEKYVHKIADIINSFVNGFESLNSFTQISQILFLSLLVWLCNLGIYYFISLAFGLNIPAWKNFLPFLMSILGVMIPSAPGFVGTFHEFCKQGLNLAGITDNNVALSYAILIHGLQYIEVTLLGLYFLWNEGISLFKITKE